MRVPFLSGALLAESRAIYHVDRYRVRAVSDFGVAILDATADESRGELRVTLVVGDADRVVVEHTNSRSLVRLRPFAFDVLGHAVEIEPLAESIVVAALLAEANALAREAQAVR